MRKIDYKETTRIFESPNVRLIETISKWFLIISIFFALTVFLINMVYEVAPVSGASMENTLYGDELNDTVVVNVFLKYGNGDIVIIDRSDNATKKTFHIKRIVGMPGDILDIVDKDGHFYLERNGEIVSERYIKARRDMATTAKNFQNFKKDIANARFFNEDGKLVVPKNMVYVLGDNRGNSTDSSINGPYSMKDVVGKVQYVVPKGVSVMQYLTKNFFRLHIEAAKVYENV